MQTRGLISIALLLAVQPVLFGGPDPLIAQSGIKGGITVFLGCGEGTPSDGLDYDDKYLVCFLDTDSAVVNRVKDRIAAKGVYGQVSAETYDGMNLPFGDNIVNLLIIRNPSGVKAEEIERVMVPRGVVMFKPGELLPCRGLNKSGSAGDWDVYRKPWPDDIDEWTHFLYGAANNAVSRDRRVGKPRRVQWFAGPEHARDHDALASLSAMTTSNGRVFYIYDEGPVDTPPTIVSGGSTRLCVFGCGDGSVYCLNANDGRLVWRFKTSEVERRIGCEDRLESPWRISGAVLVRDATVYFAAGRSSHMDGGIKLYGLDLSNGAQKHFYNWQSRRNARQGSLAGILTEKGAGVSMRNASFDLTLGAVRGQTSAKGFLDAAWFHRQGGATGAGQLNVRNGTGAYSAVNPYTGLKKKRSQGIRARKDGKWNQIGYLHQKYTRYLQKDWFPAGTVIKGKGWSIQEDIQPLAMLVAGDRLYLAGWLDEVAIELKTGRPSPDAGPRKSVLRVYRTKDGSRAEEYKLESEPAWDSAVAAEGRLFLSLKSGKIICMGGVSPPRVR